MVEDDFHQMVRVTNRAVEKNRTVEGDADSLCLLRDLDQMGVGSRPYGQPRPREDAGAVDYRKADAKGREGDRYRQAQVAGVPATVHMQPIVSAPPQAVAPAFG